MERAALGLKPRASHPADPEPNDARRGGDRPSSTDLELPAQLTFSVDLQSGSSLNACDLASHVAIGIAGSRRVGMIALEECVVVWTALEPGRDRHRRPRLPPARVVRASRRGAGGPVARAGRLTVGWEPLPEESYTNWALSWSDRLCDLHVAVLIALADDYLQYGSLLAASRLAVALVELDPLNGGAYRWLMVAYACAAGAAKRYASSWPAARARRATGHRTFPRDRGLAARHLRRTRLTYYRGGSPCSALNAAMSAHDPRGVPGLLSGGAPIPIERSKDGSRCNATGRRASPGLLR